MLKRLFFLSFLLLLVIPIIFAGTTKIWNGTSYNIPAAGDTNWSSLSAFLLDLADNAQTTNVQKTSIRVATSTPIEVSASSDYTIVSNLSVAGAVAVTLPAGVTSQTFVIVDGKGDSQTNNITVTPDGAETIDSQATYVIDNNGGYVIIQFVGTNWVVLSSSKTKAYVNAESVGNGNVNNAEFSYLDGLSESIQTSLNSKIDDSTGSVNSNNILNGTILDEDINASANINSNKLGTGVVSNTEFNYLDGVTSSIQDQINSKLTTATSLLDDISNVDTTGKVEGQALVWNGSGWVEGSSGDSSFKMIAFDDTTITINAGTERYNGGKLYGTYDGAGNNENDLTTNHTYTPSGLGASETWHLYYDTQGSVEATLTDSGRTVFLLEDDDYFKSSDNPASGNVNLTRYRYIGSFTTDGDSDIDAIYPEIPRDASSWANIKLIEDKVKVRYTTTSGQSFASGFATIVDFTTKDYDEPGNDHVDRTGDWKFTAPRDGKYLVNVAVLFETPASGWSEVDYVLLIVFKNGTASTKLVRSLGLTGSDFKEARGSAIISLSKGDYISIKATQNSGESASLTVIEGYTYIEITEIESPETGAVASTMNTYNFPRYTSAPDQGDCDIGYSAFVPPSNIDVSRTPFNMCHNDNSNSSYTCTPSLSRDVRTDRTNNQWCVDFESSDFDSGDYVDAWAKAVDVGALPVHELTTLTATATLGNIQSINPTVLVDATSGAVTVNLPTAASNFGKSITFKKTDSSFNTVTLDANDTETIDGALTYKLYIDGQGLKLQSDGSDWVIVNDIDSKTVTCTPVQDSGGLSFTTTFCKIKVTGKTCKIRSELVITSGGSATDINFSFGLDQELYVAGVKVVSGLVNWWDDTLSKYETCQALSKPDGGFYIMCNNSPEANNILDGDNLANTHRLDYFLDFEVE